MIGGIQLSEKSSMELESVLLIMLKDGPIRRDMLGGLLFMISMCFDITFKGKVIDPREFLNDLEEHYRWDKMVVKLPNGLEVKL